MFGTPDELRGEAVTAAIVLADSSTAGDDLVAELQQHVRTRLGKHLYPRRIVFVDELPSTPSGKIQRRVLRDRWPQWADCRPVSARSAWRGEARGGPAGP